MPKEAAEHMKAAVEKLKICKGVVVTVDVPTSAIVAMTAGVPKPANRRISFSVQTPDDSFKGIDAPEGVEYRKKPLEPRQELMFDRLYVTKTGKPTFVFKPCDAREWLHAEFDLDTIDNVFPDFSYKAAELLKTEHPDIRFPLDPKSADVYARTLNYVKKRHEAEKKAEAEELMSRMEQHPDWGVF